MKTISPVILSCLCVLLSGFECVYATADDDDRGPRILLVQPVVTRSDEGADPAAVRTYTDEVEAVFRQANVYVVWLPTVVFDSTNARDGLISPNEVKKLGREKDILTSGFPRLDLGFVNAINGKPGLQGLGETPGTVCFVALTQKKRPPEREAFCIIHEMTHCFGLMHAVDDPHVDNDLPSIMGEGGSFSDRIGKSALQPTHIDTIRKSTLLLKRAR